MANNDRQKGPAAEFRYGRIKVSVWENATEKNGVWYSVVATRSYQDQKKQWQSSHSFGRDDLLPLAQLLKQAWAFVVAESAANGRQRTQPEPDGEVPF
jgi:hypothetical protein